MLKNISSLGRALNKAEQKGVNGMKAAPYCPTSCVGKPHGTPCWGASNCTCPGICSNYHCVHY